jgi:HlyD family secretion protein
MKKYLKIIHNPKYITIISLTVAIIIGFIGLAIINRTPNYQFVKAQTGTIENVWSLGNSKSSGQNLTLSFQTSGRINSVLVKNGDAVKSGEVLATLDPQNTLGALTQAKAVYASAIANYNKLINGATSPDIEVSKTLLESAKITLEHNQEILLQSLNNSLTTSISAVYNKTDAFFDNPESSNPDFITNGVSFNNQILEYHVKNERISINNMLSSWKAELAKISTSSDLTALTNNTQNNLQSIATYLDDMNNLYTAYASINSNSQIASIIGQGNIISARSTITTQISSLTSSLQAVSSSKTSIAQSEANLNLKMSPARSEDIANAEAQVTSAQGAIQIAEAAYDNRIITAPGDGIVAAVYITVGQNATQNSPAIDLTGKIISKNVAIMIPNSTIIDRDGDSYVTVKIGNNVQEKKIIAGASDATNTEVISGISVGDEVANH